MVDLGYNLDLAQLVVTWLLLFAAGGITGLLGRIGFGCLFRLVSTAFFTPVWYVVTFGSLFTGTVIIFGAEAVSGRLHDGLLIGALFVSIPISVFLAWLTAGRLAKPKQEEQSRR